MGGFLLAMQSGAVRAHNLLMRVALVHDYLTHRSGAERVVLSMLKAFPGAPLGPERDRPTAIAQATTFAAATGSGPRELTGSAR